MGAAASLFSTVVAALADRVAQHPSVPPANREALRATALVVIACELQSMFGGEQLRMYVPRLSAEQRQARDERIGAAPVDAADDLTRREHLSDRHVRRLRGRIGGDRGA
jgi:hypothetical protein